MPPKLPPTPADAYAAVRSEVIPQYARSLAALWGPPPNSRKLTDAEKVRLWQLRWPREPLSPEVVQAHQALDPKDRMRHPSVERVAELLQMGFAAEAQTVWNWPFREDAYRSGNPDPEEFTKEAVRIARLVMKADQERNESAVAGPEMPLPSEMGPSAGVGPEGSA